jgi:hypothetical protein
MDRGGPGRIAGVTGGAANRPPNFQPLTTARCQRTAGHSCSSCSAPLRASRMKQALSRHMCSRPLAWRCFLCRLTAGWPRADPRPPQFPKCGRMQSTAAGGWPRRCAAGTAVLPVPLCCGYRRIACTAVTPVPVHRAARAAVSGPTRLLTSRSWKGAAPVQDLSVLTPPLLMCAAVLFAVGAFLRHEMRKKRPDADEGDPKEQAVPESGTESADCDVTDADTRLGTRRER